MEIKRILRTVLIISLMIFLLAACGKSKTDTEQTQPKTEQTQPKFESEEAMFAVLNGMWVVDESPITDYLIIENDQIQLIDTAHFKQAVETVMYSTLESEGFKTLIQLDYQTVLDKLTASDMFENTYCDIDTDFEEGIVKIRTGNGDNYQIVVEKDQAGIIKKDGDNVTPLEKVSETADFSGDHFELIFNVTKENLPLPADQFWMDPMFYGDYVKARKMNDYWWVQVSNTEKEVIYQTIEDISTISGVFIADEDSVTYSYKVIVSNSWDPDFCPQFVITYQPKSGGITIIDKDNTSLNLPDLVSYGAQAVSSFPGAYDNYVDLYNALASVASPVSDGIQTAKLTKSGLTYFLQVSTDGSYAQFDISSDAWTLGEAINATPVCSQCKKYEPDAVFYSDWSMGDSCMACSGVNMMYCPFCDNPYPEGGSCDKCIP